MDILFIESSVRMVAVMGIRLLISNTLGLPATRPGSGAKDLLVEGLAEFDLERIFFVRELFGQIPSIAPERKVRACGLRGLRREGRARPMVLLVGRAGHGRGMRIGRMCGRGEGAEGDIGGTAGS